MGQTSSCKAHHGDGLLVAGLFFTDNPPSWEKIPPVEDPGLCDPTGEPGPDRCVVDLSPTRGTEHFGFPPVLRNWAIKGLGMSCLVSRATYRKEKGIVSRWSVSF